jgi:hypothetical protein
LISVTEDDSSDSDSESDRDVTKTAAVDSKKGKYDPKYDVKLTAHEPKVELEKFNEKKLAVSTPEIVESDSEYETEKVYEFREWYPPDFWRAKVQDKKDRIFMTDVTASDVTITMTESCNRDGFFKAL